MHAHTGTVGRVNEAGQELISSEGGAHADLTRGKLDKLNSQWEVVLGKCRDRQIDLEESLREAKHFHDELQDLLVRLSEIDGQMITSKPVGGLPESAKEQLDKFMDVYTELEESGPRVKALLDTGHNLLGKASAERAARNLNQSLDTMQKRWDNIMARANDRKNKLEEAVKQAGSFHNDLNAFIVWLTETERTLTALRPVSRVLDPVMEQIEAHKVLQRDILEHREPMTMLDKTGTHLKYFSQKQDVILIKNLLNSVQHRWDSVVSRSALRTRHLDQGYKESKQFYDAWKELLDWLEDSEKIVNDDTNVGNDPDKIKLQVGMATR